MAQPAGRFTYQGLSAADRQRVDSLCRAMSLEEKVGQMFVPAVFLQTPAQVSRALYLIDSCRVGGVSLYRNDPKAVLDFLAQAQQHSRRVPLLPAMTLERGLAMRLDGTFGYPWPLTMGALGNDTLVYQVGRRIGEACRQMGIYANFAPSADVNTEPENPIIGVRSFGEDPHRVAGKVAAFVRGMQDAGVLASVKHFPGHGATRTDSHKELPVLPFSARRLEEVELRPFEKACRSGVASVMTGHLYVPAFDSVGERPSSLSERIVGGILRRAWNYQGLVITDALNMRGVSGRYGCGEAEIEAILAGKSSAETKERAKAAKFDERLSLLGLLLDAATAELRAALQTEDTLTRYLDALKRFRAALAEGKQASAALEGIIADDEKKLADGKKAGSLSREQQNTALQAIRLLEEQRQALSEAADAGAAFAAVKKDFDARVAKMKKQASAAGKSLENVFTFCEEAFGDSQEMLILVTELTINPHSARFIGNYGCKKYFEHNKELLFHERQIQIIKEMANLELED